VEVLYRWEEGSPGEAAQAVGRVLGIELELHDSSFYGGDYFRAADDGPSIIVLENFIEDDGEPFFLSLPVGASCVQVDAPPEVITRLDHLDGLTRAPA
jgi:hypothetical protein